MASNRYEKIIGYNKQELKYKKEMVVDSVSGKNEVKLVERTPEEIEEYKRQKEQEFDGILNTWENLGIRRCSTKDGFDEKRFGGIYRKLVNERLKELSNSHQTKDIESSLLQSIDDVDKKYHLEASLGYYLIKNDDYTSTNRLFKNLSKAELEKMFYQKISVEGASELARDRLSQSTTLNEGVAAIQELQKTHANRSFFFKIFHPFKNADENNLIREMKAEVKQKYGITDSALNRKLAREIDKSTLGTAELYKLDEFINNHCYEKSGKLYSEGVINADRQSVAERADNDFLETQRAFDRILENNARESIVVEDAREVNNVERSSEVVREDPNIIKVPNNDK